MSQFEVNRLIEEALFRALPINFYWMDVNGILLGCNDRVLQDLELNSISNFVGKHSTEVASIEAWENSKKIMEFQQTQKIEEVHIKENGNKINYLSIKSPIFSHTKKVIGLVGISIDLGERKKLAPDHILTRIKGQYELLTARELDCINKFVLGYSAKEIAKILGLSPRTVEDHLQNAKAKLGCSKRSEVVQIMLAQRS